MTRRECLSRAAAWLGGGVAFAESGAGRGQRRRVIESAAGPIPADRLGRTLMHEHVLVDFIGADKVSPTRYDTADVVRAVVPHLKQLRALGCDTLVECTPAYLGRDAGLLKRLSEAADLNILSNTGYYGAANDKHLPAHAFTESADRLAARWIREAEKGIDGTSVKPAFMKVGVDGSPLSEVDKKLVRAAAVTNRATGLAIASHTATGAAAMEEMDLLENAGVPLASFIWVHAQSERDSTLHARAATRGAWVEFDGVSPSSAARHAELVQQMKTQGLLRHVLISHDAGWYRVGEPGGGQFRPYDTVFTAFIPAIRAAGFTDADLQQLFVTNPRHALTGRE